MKRTLKTLMIAAMGILIAMPLVAQDKKADPTGNWTWSTTGQDGTKREAKAKLKLDGDKLTGTVSGRQSETPIADAKIDGDKISFTVTREFNGNKFVQKFNGKIDGDTITGKVETSRDGQSRSTDWEAKRAK